jgi:hypothetical protein
VKTWKSGWFKKRNRSEREGSHLLQGRQRRVHSNRIREAGGSHVSDFVEAKAGRFTRPHHKPPRERDKLVGAELGRRGGKVEIGVV